MQQFSVSASLKSWSKVISQRSGLLCCITFVLLTFGQPAFAQPVDSGDERALAGGANVENAKAAPAIPTSPREIVRAIGYSFSLVFVIASITALWSAIERLVMLRRRRVIPRAFVDRFLVHLRSGRMDRANAIAVCQQNESPIAQVFLHGVQKWGKSSVEVEQAVIDGGQRQVNHLKKRLRVLNGVATLMPLVGLLGTVIGMIQAFNDIAHSKAMGQAQELAMGIAMALLTTAIGLLIAIPALAAYMYLAGRLDSLAVEMDHLGQQVVHLISAEGLQQRSEETNPQQAKRDALRQAAKAKADSSHKS